VLVNTTELEKIMRKINGPSYRDIYDVAERYVKKRHPGQGETMRPLQTRVASLFIHAMQDFLSRDSKSEAEAYERDADTLDAAMKIAARDGMFTSRMISRGQSDESAIWALSDMASSFRNYAKVLARDKKNKTFFYCLGRRFGLADIEQLPTPKQADNAYLLLMSILRAIVPKRHKEIEKKDYSTPDDLKEVRSMMCSGFKSAQHPAK